MTTFSRLLLSGSTSGKPISVAAIVSPGTLLHTAVAGALAFDELYLYASNVTDAPVSLTVEFGGLTDPADLLVKQVNLPANSGAVAIAVGQSINGGVEIRAFSSIAGAVNFTGHVNRIS